MIVSVNALIGTIFIFFIISKRILMKKGIFNPVALAITVILFNGVAVASDWIALTNDTLGDKSFVNSNIKEIYPKALKLALVMRDYNKPSNLGLDPVSGNEVHPHQSVEIGYLVNCANKSIALKFWKLFSGKKNSGNVVWSGESNDNSIFYVPTIEEEKHAADYACGTRKRREIASK